MTFLSHLINGISLGSVYAIIALGYTMVYGIAKMLNFAHGDVIMVGAYISFCTTSYLGLSPLVSVLFSIIVCTVLGIVVERLAYKPRSEERRVGKECRSRWSPYRSGSFPRSSDHCHRRFLFSAECRPADLGLQPENLFFRNRKLDLKAF